MFKRCGSWKENYGTQGGFLAAAVLGEGSVGAQRSFSGSTKAMRVSVVCTVMDRLSNSGM